MIDKKIVEDIIDRIRPYLRRDGGDVELIDITEDNVVKVRLVGACGTCPMSMMTLRGGIEAELKKAIPELKSVEAV